MPGITGTMVASLLGTALAGAAGSGISAMNAKKQRKHDKEMETIHTIGSNGKDLNDDLVEDIDNRFNLRNMGPIFSPTSRTKFKY